MSFESAVTDIAPLLQKRLGLTPQAAADLAESYVLAVADQAVVNVRSQTVGPTALSSTRVQLVEQLAARLQRLPTVRELTALLRVPESTARTILRNVLSMSDRVNDVALKSIFARAQSTGNVGNKGTPKNGKIWELASDSDLGFARELLEARGVDFVTSQEGDGRYVLVVDPRFDPGQL